MTAPMTDFNWLQETHALQDLVERLEAPGRPAEQVLNDVCGVLHKRFLRAVYGHNEGRKERTEQRIMLATAMRWGAYRQAFGRVAQRDS